MQSEPEKREEAEEKKKKRRVRLTNRDSRRQGTAIADPRALHSCRGRRRE